MNRMRQLYGIALCVGVIASLPGCSPSPVDTGPDAEILFLVPFQAPSSSMEALYQGRVQLDQEGCMRLSDDPAGHTVVWPFGSRLARDQASLVVLDSRGVEVGRVGHLLALSGGETHDIAGSGVLSGGLLGAALERCPGPFWISGAVLPHPGR